jgi:DNA-binding PadR family transcriptional regulator
MRRKFGRHGDQGNPGGDDSPPNTRKFMRGFERHFHEHFGRGLGRGWGRGFAPGGGRTRRGDVKYVVLELLSEGPRHGYDIIRGIEERHGVRPSAGSVYPTLQMLEDGDFVRSEQVDGKRIYTITDSGREMLANRAADPEESAGQAGSHELRHAAFESMRKLVAAAANARHADDASIEKVRTILDRARKEIYGVLASDEA